MVLGTRYTQFTAIYRADYTCNYKDYYLPIGLSMVLGTHSLQASIELIIRTTTYLERCGPAGQEAARRRRASNRRGRRRAG